MAGTRVLGVDPGLSRCGLAVVEGDARSAQVRAGEVVRTPADAPRGERLAAVHAAVARLLDAHQPEVVAVERVFVNANVSTGVGTAQAAGVVHLLAHQRGLPALEYTPSQVKAAITGTGDADKDQVGFMVRALLKLAEVPRPADLADALAVALCHLQQPSGVVAAGSSTAGAGLSPRLAAAIARAEAGAQVINPRR